MSKDNLRTIGDLNKNEYEFVIPSYQRGYRWNEQQVVDLLEDIKEFNDSDPAKDNFYCVQPLIVQKGNIDGREIWYVIDGQQRLTTIYIIMSYIKALFPQVYEINFNISYVTRDSSRDFLENISNENYRELHRESNIDFYFMANCYKTVKKWFGEDKNTLATLAMKIMGRLLEQVKFIWYEIGEEDDPIETFTRINLGKIPLTNSELIKALLLKRDNFQNDNNDEEYVRLKQLEIASEWNIIENTLQNDEFWYFINGDKKYETRIEFLFEILVEILDGQKSEDREYKIFHFINNLYNIKIDEGLYKVEVIEDIWGKLKTIYYILEEWYTDRTLYHYIGFIVSENIKSLSRIMKDIKVLNKDEGMKKNEILDEIKKAIRNSVDLDCDLEELNYTKDGKMIRKILLLFNIQTLEQNNASYRFPFYLYKKENWDLEHIHAIKSSVPKRRSEQRTWLEMIEKDIFLKGREKGSKLQKEAKDMLDGSIDDDRFNALYADIISEYGVNNDNDSISNITLLDSGTNKSYKNSPFPIKREIIINSDKEGKFIPVCTKNVFLKYYSESVEQMNYWSEKDEKDYMEAMKITLSDFINSNWGDKDEDRVNI